MKLLGYWLKYWNILFEIVDFPVHLWTREMGVLSVSFFMLSSWRYLYGIIIPSLFQKVYFNERGGGLSMVVA